MTMTVSLALPDLKPEDAANIREKWVSDVNGLARQVREWAAAEGWPVKEVIDKQIVESPLGAYSVPVVVLNTPHGTRVFVDPMARNVGGKGAVEIYVLPTLRRAKLLHDIAGVEWQILTDSGISLREPWNRDTFAHIVRDMTGADADPATMFKTATLFPNYQEAVKGVVEQHLELGAGDAPTLAIYYAPARLPEDAFLFEISPNFVGNEGEPNWFEVTYAWTPGFPTREERQLHLVLTNPEEFEQAAREQWASYKELAEAFRTRRAIVLFGDVPKSLASAK